MIMKVKWFKRKTTPSGQLLKDAISDFKKMRVRRYNWSVKDAHRNSHPDLKKSLLDGKSAQTTYFVLFGIEQDLTS